MEPNPAAFRTVNTTLVGDLLITDALRLNGSVTGSVTVASGGSLMLNGTCVGDLIVESGGEAWVNGSIGGSATNNGGTLHVFGTVVGVVRSVFGRTEIDPDALILGRAV